MAYRFRRRLCVRCSEAVLTKMLRVTLLLPVVMVLSMVVRHRLKSTENRAGDPLLPLFLLAFLAFVVVGSLGWVPKPSGAALNEVSRACLVIAIAAVGLKTSLLEMKKVGARALVLLSVEAAFSRASCSLRRGCTESLVRRAGQDYGCAPRFDDTS